MQKFHPLLGIVFIVAGLTILVLCFVNYRQDGRFSTSILFGLMGIAAGLFMLSARRRSRND